MRPRSTRFQAIVLKRQNFGEADKILTVMTREEGKVKVVAKGVRRITSRRSSHVELLNLATLFVYRGRSMPILTEAVVLHDFDDVKKDLNKIGFAYHFCELIDSLCPEEQRNEKAFSLLRDVLVDLSTSADHHSLTAEFEHNLLQALGFIPHEKTLESKQFFIEQILERKLNARKFLTQLES